MPVSTLISDHINKSENHESKLSASESAASSSTCQVRYESNGLNSNSCLDRKSEESSTNSLTHSVIPVNIPYDLNLCLNCMVVPSVTLSSIINNSCQNSPTLSNCCSTTSSSTFSNSLSISSSTSPISLSSAAASPASSSCSSSSGFCENSSAKASSSNIASSSRKYRLSIVKIEEEEEDGTNTDESSLIVGDDSNDLITTIGPLDRKVQLSTCTSGIVIEGEEEEENTSCCLSTTECDWDLDFDEVNFDECDESKECAIKRDNNNDGDENDTDIEVTSTSASVVSPFTTTNTISDSNSNSSFIYNTQSSSSQSNTNTSSSGVKKRRRRNNHSDSLETVKSDDDNSEYLSLENPNPVPCPHCQVNKDHIVDENLVWPIQLDLDLIKTLFQLCPELFAEFVEVEDEMDFREPTTTESTTNINSELQDSSSNNSSLIDIARNLQSPSSSTTTENPASVGPESMDSSSSPPHVQVDDSPLQKSMDRNKESLKVKLLLRRPMNQLVEQGILPPPKTPPAFAGQRVRLERARMGDLLKAKIQQRPARQELIRQHILEDSNARVAPALAEKQRMLKKARLADSLNDHLIHRPGPLELVQKNILHAPDESIDQAIKEGAVQFKATSEGHVPGPHLPHSYLSEDDSSSDLSSPAGTPDQSQSTSTDSSKAMDTSTAASSATNIANPDATPSTSNACPVPVSVVPQIPPPPPPPSFSQPSASPIVTPTPTNQQTQNQVISRIVQAAVTSTTVPPLTSAQLTLSKLSQIDQAQLNSLMNNVSQNQNQGQRTFVVAQGINFSNQPVPQQHSSGSTSSSSSKSRSSKKSSKPKSQPKTRQIKFHEYKGPPSAQKNQQQLQSQNHAESSYELLLQQQQLFLQWQLECQNKVNKYPKMLLPAVSKLTSPTEATAKLLSSITAAGATISVHSSPPPSTASITTPTVLSPSTISAASNPNVISTASSPATVTGHFQISSVTPAKEQHIADKEIKQVHLQPPPISFINPIHKVKEMKAAETSENSNDKGSPKPASCTTPVKSISLTKLSEWKVNDLRAELKRRNLPISGSKPQLIDRLKSADLSLQDESVSTTTHNTLSKSTSSNNLAVKSEVAMEESTPSFEMMEVNETHTTKIKQSNPNGGEVPVREVKMDIKPIGTANANAALLAFLRNNNIKLNPDGSIPAHILSALASATKKQSSGKASTSQVNAGPSIILVNEAKIRDEQQKKIEKLQEELKNSQQQLLQMQSQQQLLQLKSQQGGAQKHRIALQQHLQHKMEQTLQAQLQKLQMQLQLQSLHQQQSQPTKMQLSQVSTKIQPQYPQIQIIADHPQRAVPGQQTTTIHQRILPKPDECEQQKLLAKNLQNQIATSNHNSTIPFTILKIATTTTTHLQTPDNKEELQMSGIPQILIPEGNETSFQVGKSSSSQGSNIIPVPEVSADQNDQSWLLKIKESQVDSKTSSSDMTDFFNNILSANSNDNGKLSRETIKVSWQQAEPSSNNNTQKNRNNVKSQMVDDVLEILIRHGELPPSAAQEPATPTTPGKSPAVLSYPRQQENLAHTQPPPPPPLPPATFAVTLPTSILFPKPSTASVFSGHSVTPNTTAVNDYLPKSEIHQSVQYVSSNSEALSKEAQDILKISEDLSNFGKAHAESHNRIVYTSPINKLLQSHFKLQHNHNGESLTLLLGDVEKDLHLVDDMDIALDDHSSHQFHQDQPLNHSNVVISLSNAADTPMTTLDHRQHHNQNISFQSYSHDRANEGIKAVDGSEELLDELGTLIPDDLDMAMPMEMDYSEWLEDLLPAEDHNLSGGNEESSFNSKDSNNVNMSHFLHRADIGIGNRIPNGTSHNSHFYDHSETPFSTNNNGTSESTQRDPLLSSSTNIFSTLLNTCPNVNSTLNVINTVNSQNDLLKANESNRAPSPMTMGNDSLLWDFA